MFFFHYIDWLSFILFRQQRQVSKVMVGIGLGLILDASNLEFSSLIIKHYKGVACRALRPGELPQQVEEAKWCDSDCDEDYLGRNHRRLEGNFSSPLTTFDIVCFACCWIYIVNPTDKCKLYNDQGSQIKISGFPRDRVGMQTAMIVLLISVFSLQFSVHYNVPSAFNVHAHRQELICSLSMPQPTSFNIKMFRLVSFPLASPPNPLTWFI